MSDAGSSPTSTVASPGGTPVSAVSAATSRATSARTSWAIALPSMIVAAISLPPGDGGVGGHQLALGAVGGEAHDDDAPGLDPGHHALAERGVADVVAQPELRRGRGLAA